MMKIIFKIIFVSIFYFVIFPSEKVWASNRPSLCLDGFCIGQSIQSSQFDKVNWIVPRKSFIKEKCDGVGCQPSIAFYGYPKDEQRKLASAVSWIYNITPPYNLITKANLAILRQYKYECNSSPRGIFGERRFFGAYHSIPSGYLTVVGLRLIGNELKIYRVARQYPYQNKDELFSLAKELHAKYGTRILFYDYLSSNAYSDVIRQHKDGWFGRSTPFNPTDLSDNAAELVLIDPRTRSLLGPSSMPESGEIKPLPVNISEHCNKPIPIQ